MPISWELHTQPWGGVLRLAEEDPPGRGTCRFRPGAIYNPWYQPDAELDLVSPALETRAWLWFPKDLEMGSGHRGRRGSLHAAVSGLKQVRTVKHFTGLLLRCPMSGYPGGRKGPEEKRESAGSVAGETHGEGDSPGRREPREGWGWGQVRWGLGALWAEDRRSE